MKNYIISTDSGCDLSLDFCKSNGIVPLQLNYSFGNESYKDPMEASKLKAFYNRMRNNETPKTSTANVSDYTSFWETLDWKNNTILHIALGSGFSGTYQAGLIAKNEFEEAHPDSNIILIDSTLASSGTGILLIQAVKMRNEGTPVGEVVKWIEEHKKNVHAIITTSDMTYMYRGGRVRKATMMVAHALGINPILHLDSDGCVKVFEKARGKLAMLSKLRQIVKERAIDPGKQTLYIAHSESIEKAKEIADELCKTLHFRNVFFTEMGAVVGTHAGPGTAAIFFIGSSRSAKA